MSFEDALAELEQIVRRLEAGQVKLDDAISVYERGAQLKRHCERKLNEAQQRVERIVVGPDGADRGGAGEHLTDTLWPDAVGVPRGAGAGGEPDRFGARSAARRAARTSRRGCCEAMRYSALASGQAAAPVPGAGQRAAVRRRPAQRAAGRGGGRDGPRLFAGARRPAGDGRQRSAARPADLPQGVRRGDRGARRRRALDHGVRGAGRIPTRTPTRRCAASWWRRWPRRPAPPAWSAAR